MSEKKKTTVEGLNEEEVNLVLLALGKLQSAAQKVSKGAEGLNAEKIAKSANEYCAKIEELKTKFL